MRNGAGPSANPGWRSSAHVLLKDGQGLFPWESAKNHGFPQTRCTPLPLLLWWLSHDLWKTISPIVPSWNPTFPGPKIQKIFKFHLHLLVFSSFPHSLINRIKIKQPCHVSKFFLGAKPGSTLRAEAPQGPLPKKHHLQADKLKGILNKYPHYNKVKCQLHSSEHQPCWSGSFPNWCLRRSGAWIHGFSSCICWGNFFGV